MVLLWYYYGIIMVILWYYNGIIIGGKAEKLWITIGWGIDVCSYHILKQKSVQQILLNGSGFYNFLTLPINSIVPVILSRMR